MSSEMRKDDKLILCMLGKDKLHFMRYQRAGTGQAAGLRRHSTLLGAEGYTQNQRAIASAVLHS